MRNSGIELTVSADVIKNSDFTWETSFNITTNKNKVISLADGVENILKGDNGGLKLRISQYPESLSDVCICTRLPE